MRCPAATALIEAGKVQELHFESVNIEAHLSLEGPFPSQLQPSGYRFQSSSELFGLGSVSPGTTLPKGLPSLEECGTKKPYPSSKNPLENTSATAPRASAAQRGKAQKPNTTSQYFATFAFCNACCR